MPTASQLRLARESIHQILAEDLDVTGPTLHSPSMVPSSKEAQSPTAAWNKVHDALKTVEMRLRMMEVPIKRTLSETLASLEKVGNPNLSQKATAKFNRIFKALLDPVSDAQNALKPVISHMGKVNDRLSAKTEELQTALNQRGEDKKELRRQLKSLRASKAEATKAFMGVEGAISSVQQAISAVNPQAYKAAINAEMQKQGKALLELKKVYEKLQGSPSAQARPEVLAKLKSTLQEGMLYMQNLKELADPYFEDRVKQATERAMKEDLPSLHDSTQKLLSAYQSVPDTKAAQFARVLASLSTKGDPKTRKISKRIRKVAKTIVYLRYLALTS